MLASLKMELVLPAEIRIDYPKSSIFQGIIMENIDSDYADFLHINKYHPYSQHIEHVSGKTYWVINSLNDEAYEKIITKLNDNLDEIYIKKNDIKLSIGEKNLIKLSDKSLIERFYSEESSKYICMEFITPTAFKSNGRYVNMPDTRLIFQSLMHKYSESNEEISMFDMDTLDTIANNSFITQYKLHSTYFPLEGIKIPAFKGGIIIKMRGNATMAKYASMLAEYGKYSGVGVKTSIGMGAITLRDWRNKY